VTLCGLFEALSATVSVPVRCPAAVGVNVTAIVQLAPAATELPHVLVCEKSPDVLRVEIVNADEPLLVSVTICGALEDCTVWFAKVRLVGDSATDALLDDEPPGLLTGGDDELPPHAISAPSHNTGSAAASGRRFTPGANASAVASSQQPAASSQQSAASRQQPAASGQQTAASRQQPAASGQ
jgi:hypothetical protein